MYVSWEKKRELVRYIAKLYHKYNYPMFYSFLFDMFEDRPTSRFRTGASPAVCHSWIPVLLSETLCQTHPVLLKIRDSKLWHPVLWSAGQLQTQNAYLASRQSDAYLVSWVVELGRVTKNILGYRRYSSDFSWGYYSRIYRDMNQKHVPLVCLKMRN